MMLRTSTDSSGTRPQLKEVSELLDTLGKGTVASVAYDTAWQARVSKTLPQFPVFESGLDWLRSHQHTDGSWGEAKFVHHHDRFISTVSALLALKENDNSKDNKRIEAGVRFLWQGVANLISDPNDTIGFPVLCAGLLQEARQMGLDVPKQAYFDLAIIEKKLNKLGSDNSLWQGQSIAFSLEGIIRNQMNDEPHFLSKNGSVLGSPSATAALVKYMTTNNTKPLSFLLNTIGGQSDGGSPAIMPIDIFEIAWTFNQLRLVDALDYSDPRVKGHLDFLWNNWNPEYGASPSTASALCDLDDTATVFAVLAAAGYPVDAEVFQFYEREDHFMCFPNEADPSWSAVIRLLLALNEVKDHPKKKHWQQKILAILHKEFLCYDKWHVSPYYLLSMAVIALCRVDRELASYYVKWLTCTQRTNGGWGQQSATLEETAYAITALVYWHKHIAKVPMPVIEKGRQYLVTHNGNKDEPALWIGKSLYYPTAVVEGAVIAALQSCLTL
jgi:halimadienyl-diphosphate synthase